jgi:predicted transcriptional regulator
MSEKNATKKVKSFRMEPELTSRVVKLAKRLDLPQSWIINQALKKHLPELEAQVKSTEKAVA